MARRKNPLSGRMRRQLIAAAVLLLIGLIAAQRLGYLPQPTTPTTQTPLPAGDFARYHAQEFTVAQVVDGDTLDLDIPDGNQPHTRVRLWGVDTPETVAPNRPKGYFGTEASAFTKRTTLQKRVRVELEPTKAPRDRYKRLLAYIYLPDGKMLNEELLRQGYAYADERFKHQYFEQFLDLEKQAQRSGAGLWQGAKFSDYPEWYQKRHR